MAKVTSTIVGAGCLAALVLSVAGWEAAPAQEGAREKESGWTVEGFFKTRSGLARRENGVLLAAEVVVEGRRAELRWTLEYDGPRPPLIILDPALDNPTEGQTEVLVYAVGKDDYLCEKSYKSVVPVPGVRTIPDFLTIPRGERKAGAILLHLADLRAHFYGNWPTRFGGPPPPMFVQLRHSPKWRDYGLRSLDAWTGELYTKVVSFPKLSEW